MREFLNSVFFVGAFVLLIWFAVLIWRFPLEAEVPGVPHWRLAIMLFLTVLHVFGFKMTLPPERKE